MLSCEAKYFIKSRLLCFKCSCGNLLCLKHPWEPHTKPLRPICQLAERERSTPKHADACCGHFRKEGGKETRRVMLGKVKYLLPFQRRTLRLQTDRQFGDENMRKHRWTTGQHNDFYWRHSFKKPPLVQCFQKPKRRITAAVKEEKTEQPSKTTSKEN